MAVLADIMVSLRAIRMRLECPSVRDAVFVVPKIERNTRNKVNRKPKARAAR